MRGLKQIVLLSICSFFAPVVPMHAASEHEIPAAEATEFSYEDCQQVVSLLLDCVTESRRELQQLTFLDDTAANDRLIADVQDLLAMASQVSQLESENGFVDITFLQKQQDEAKRVCAAIQRIEVGVKRFERIAERQRQVLSAAQRRPLLIKALNIPMKYIDDVQTYLTNTQRHLGMQKAKHEQLNQMILVLQAQQSAIVSRRLQAKD